MPSTNEMGVGFEGKYVQLISLQSQHNGLDHTGFSTLLSDNILPRLVFGQTVYLSRPVRGPGIVSRYLGVFREAVK